MQPGHSPFYRTIQYTTEVNEARNQQSRSHSERKLVKIHLQLHSFEQSGKVEILDVFAIEKLPVQPSDFIGASD